MQGHEEITEESRTEAMAKIRECLFEGQRRDALEVIINKPLSEHWPDR